MDMNPLENSLKYYGPNEVMESLNTDVKKQCTNKTREDVALVGSYIHDDANTRKNNSPSHPKKLQSIGNSLEDDYPKKITDLDFGAPPDFDFDDDL